MTIRVSWHMLALAAVFVVVVVAAILELGPPSSSARTAREVVTAENGVVQSTVTGTGNIEPSTDVEANFQTSGVLQNVYVQEGDHVVKGQLLATLDPTSAQLTVDQAEEQLTSAEDQLTNAENETVSSSSTSTADDAPGQTTAFVSYRPTQTTTQTSTTQATTPSRTGTTPAGGSSGSPGSSRVRTGGTSGATRTTASSQASRTGASRSGSSSSSSGSGTSNGSGGSGGSTSGVTAATKAADIASAQASVDGAEASVNTAENTLHQTHLYAPASGTVVSVASTSPGDTVSAGSASSSGSGSGSSSAASSGSSGSGTGATSAGGLGGSGSGTSSSSGSSSSSSGFIEIVNTGSMTVTVPFSESDIGQIEVGQSANVTLEALTGVELAGHVSAISTLGTSSSGVVSYDATITVDQHNPQVKPGMSVSVAVVTGQASGVNLPSRAVTGTAGSVSRVNLLRSGRTVSTPVVVGLVGTSRTQIVSGLRSGQQVVVTETLPSLGTSSSSSGTGSTGTLGGSGLGGAGGLAGGGGFRRLFGGGGGGFAGGG